MKRELEWADIEAAYNYVGKRAAEVINEGQEHTPILLLILMSEEQPGVVDTCIPAPPQIVREAFSSPERKKLFGVLLRRLMKPSDLREALDERGAAPDIVAVVSEAWMVKGRGIETTDGKRHCTLARILGVPVTGAMSMESGHKVPPGTTRQ